MNKKQLHIEVKSVSDGGIEAKISTNSIDRDGEVLIPQGMNAVDYTKNPVLFWNHDYSNPIGNVTDLRRDENAIYGKLTFAKRTDDVQGEFFPEVAESLVKQGVVKGISVGFVPETGGVRNASVRDREEYGSDVKRVYNRWKLLEVSVAPLPANQDALVQAVSKGLATAHQIKSMFGVSIPTDEPKKHAIALQSPSRSRVDVSKSSPKTKRADARRVTPDHVVARLRGQIYID